MPAKKTTTDVAPDASSGSGAGADATEETLSYEQAREELMLVVRTLEQGGTSLEESLSLWERGERLASTCQRFLDEARTRLDEAIGADD